MLLALIATCVIGAGVTYTPPTGWTLQRVACVGTMHQCQRGMDGFPVTCNAMMVYPVKDNTVTLHRTVAEGETVQAPPGCTMTGTALAPLSPGKDTHD